MSVKEWEPGKGPGAGVGTTENGSIILSNGTIFVTNASEFDFPLSLHGCTMFLDGIEKWRLFTRRLYRTKLEMADYCGLRIWSAIKELTRLQNWAMNIDTDLLKGNIDYMDHLLELLQKDRIFYNKKDQEDMARRGLNPNGGKIKNG